MRYPVTTVTIFLIILIGGLRLVPLFYDFAPLVQRLVAQSNATRAFTIEHYEGADVELIPAPTVTLYNAQIVTPTIPGVTDVQSVKLEFSYLKLMAEQPVAKRVELSGLTLDVQQASLQALLDFDFQRLPNTDFGIRDGILIFTARDGRLPIRFEGADVDLSMRGPYAPLKLTIEASYAGQRYSGEAVSRLPLDTQIPLEMTVTSDEGLDVDFAGYLDRRGHPEISGEFRLVSDVILPNVLQIMGFEMAIPVPARTVFRGLFFANRRAVRADNIQLSVLGQQIEMRANVDFGPTESTDDIYIRLHAPRLNLSGLTYTGRQAPTAATPLAQLSQVFFAQPPTIETMITIDRLQVLNETIENMHLSSGSRAGGLMLHRFDVDLPFETHVFMAGAFDLTGAAPRFSGNIAVNSENAKDALIWAGSGVASMGPEIATFIRDSEMRRLSLSADVVYDEKHFAMTDLLGQVDGREYAVDISVDHQSQKVDLSLHGASFDLAQWGGVLRGIDPGAVRLTSLPFQTWTERLAVSLGEEKKLSVIFGTPDFNIGAARLGRVDGAASFEQGRVRVHNLDIAQFEGSALKLSGDLSFHTGRATGAVHMALQCAADNLCARRLEGMLSPLPIRIDQPLSITSRWVLTNPDDTARPSMTMSSVISLGDAQGTLTLRAADSDFDILKRDAKLQLSLAGRSEALLSVLSLDDFRSIEPDAAGKITLDMANAGRDTATVRAELVAGEQRAALDGFIRGLGPERQFDGTLDVLLGRSAVGQSGLEISGTSQLSLSETRANFSALNMKFGTGKISGEGVLKTDAERLNLTANLLLQNLDLSPYMPVYGTQGWSQDTLLWPILGRADAVIEFKGENFALSSLALDAVQGRLRLIDGVLEAPNLTAQIYGGTVNFSVNAEGGSLLPYLQTAGTFEGLDLATGLAAFYEPPALTGKLSGNFALRGRGRSVKGFLEGLAGQISAVGSAGDLLGFDATLLAAILADMPLAPVDDLAQAIAGQSKITRSRFDLSLANGYMGITALELDRDQMPGFNVTGGVDVLNPSLDIAIRLRESGLSQLQLIGDLLHPDLSLGPVR